MKILCFYPNEKAKSFFARKFNDIKFLAGDVQDYENFNDFADTEIITSFTASEFTKDTIDKFPNLKFIATQSTGFDHIDLEHAKEKGIVISNVPFYGANTVAEYAFSMILAMSRKVFSTYEKVQKDLDFRRRGDEEIQGFDLLGKTIGIIGLGSIGKHSAQIAHGFGMDILAFDLQPDDEYKEKYNVKYVELNELLSNSDIITLHVPYNKHTHHLIDKEALGKMKKGVIFINTSRGAVVDTLALLGALQSGTVASAGLDVVEYENHLGTADKKDSHSEETDKILEAIDEFIKMDNVIVTPHNAFNTGEAINRIWNTTVTNIEKFEKGNPENLVI